LIDKTFSFEKIALRSKCANDLLLQVTLCSKNTKTSYWIFAFAFYSEF